MASYAGASHATVTEKLCPSRHFRRTRQPSHPPLRFVGNSRFPSFYPLPLPAFVLPIFLLAAEELCRPFHEEQGWLGESVREFGGEPSSAAMEASLSGPETSARVGGVGRRRWLAKEATSFVPAYVSLGRFFLAGSTVLSLRGYVE
jgi:hypothetical protein